MKLLRFWGPLMVIVLWGTSALIGPYLALTPNAIHLETILVWHETEAWLGHDDLGRPILDRLIIGAHHSFLIAISVVTISFVLGSGLGVFAGYWGGVVDHVLTRVIDIFLAFPGILLAIALAGVMGPGFDNIVIALASVGWVGYARLARAQTLSVKEQDHVVSAVAVGSTPMRIMTFHLFPLISAPLIVEASFGLAGTIIAEASLSFLGLGIQPPTSSWGSMIREGTRYMLVAPHMVLVPGVALMAVVLAINLWGDWLRDWMDAKSPSHS